MAKEKTINIAQTAEFLLISKALANEVRLKIILLLSENSYNINDIAEYLKLPLSTVSSNIKILEDAGLIRIAVLKGKRGVMRVCSRKLDFLNLELEHKSDLLIDNEIIYNIPIGSFNDFNVSPTCGMADEFSFFIREDTPELFYTPLKAQAQIIWLKQGFLEYRIPNPLVYDSRINIHNLIRITISCELCSEAPNYQNDWKSDISLILNQNKVATYHSKGDYGGRRGKLNPSWWSSSLTQYGKLVNLQITQEGTFLNDKLVSKYTLLDVIDTSSPYLLLRFEVENDALYQGGLNLFGAKFGDFAQDIVLKFLFNTK